MNYSQKEEDIKMVLREIEWGGVEWIQMTQNGVHWWAVVNTVICFAKGPLKNY
jgi:hypothetical protein